MLTIFGFRKFHLFRGGVLKFFNHSEAELYHREQSSISILNLGLKGCVFQEEHQSIKASKHPKPKIRSPDPSAEDKNTEPHNPERSNTF